MLYRLSYTPKEYLHNIQLCPNGKFFGFPNPDSGRRAAFFSRFEMIGRLRLSTDASTSLDLIGITTLDWFARIRVGAAPDLSLSRRICVARRYFRAGSFTTVPVQV